MQAHPERIVQLNRDNHLTFKAIRDCAVPVVGALHGFVIGGGVNIAGACDALLAAEGAYFSLPEIDRGAEYTPFRLIEPGHPGVDDCSPRANAKIQSQSAEQEGSFHRYSLAPAP
jgi:hypothetical protein